MQFGRSCSQGLLPRQTHQPEAVLEHSKTKLITGLQTPSNTERVPGSAACSRFHTQQRQAANGERIPTSFSQIIPFPVRVDPGPAAPTLLQAGCSSPPQPGAGRGQGVAEAQQSESTGYARPLHHAGTSDLGDQDGGRNSCSQHAPAPPRPIAAEGLTASSPQHSTSSNFILGFIFRVKALRTPLSHFCYESSKNASFSNTA